MSLTNWAGNHVYRAREVHRPSTLEEVRTIVAGALQIRVLGSRHSFTDIGDAAELLSLDGLPAEVTVDHGAGTATLTGGLTYAALAAALEPEQVALPAMASLPHISVAGAVATGTHGSGDAFGNLATAVAGLQLVTSAGDVLEVGRGDEGFDGMVVGLGALGAVTRVTLDVEPAYDVAQRVYLGMGWDALTEHFDEVMSAADSVSAFTRWGDRVDQVWLKRRVTGAKPPLPEELFGAATASENVHPVPGQDPINCTAQLGVPGLWSDRLPHFRAGFAPSAGAELQSEFFVAREDAVAAIEAVRAVGHELQRVLQITEIRTIAADALWMSPHHGRDSVAFHFTWTRDPRGVARALSFVEPALAPFASRPHWGKVFLARAAEIVPSYERRDDFAALAARLDPRRRFRTAWLARVVGI